MVARRQIVASPNFTPSRYGLLSVAQVVTEDDERWTAGIVAETGISAQAWSYGDPCDTPPADRAKAVPSGTGGDIGADPFTVYSGWECSPAGYTEAQIDEGARTALIRGEERTVENVLWTGLTDNAVVIRPRLAENTAAPAGSDFDYPAADVVTSGATNPKVALALIEEALGFCYGGQGVIHVPAGLASLLPLQSVNGGLETRAGHRVVVGNGYPGTAPGDVAPTGLDRWIYATGAVAIRRTAPVTVGDFRSSLNRQNNTITRLVERTYTITWDHCLIGAQTTLTA